MTHDLVVKGGRVATADGVFDADIAVSGGRIAALGHDLDGAEVIDAAGTIVTPGGIESHCHIAQESSAGMMTADDYLTGSRSAALGGTTTIIPFAAQLKGQPIADVLKVYDDRAATSHLDYSYHLIVTDTSVPGFRDDMLAAARRGVTSFKVFLTYDIALTDQAFLEVLEVARDADALTMVHAENNGLLDWLRAAHGRAGTLTPPYHALSRPPEAEAEAIARAITLAGAVGAGLFIVHVSTAEGMALIRAARANGQPVFAETCPQYLFLTADDLSRTDGAKFICSPPLRDLATQRALWAGLKDGTLDMASSDHAPYRYDETGKLANGLDDYRKIANGMPGIGARAPLIFSEGVTKGRISLPEFVALTSANAARIFGLAGRKGTLAPGADADLVLWDPAEQWTVTQAALQDAMDYTPFEGMRLTGRPVTALQRGRVVVRDGALQARPGDGQFLARTPSGKPAAHEGA